MGGNLTSDAGVLALYAPDQREKMTTAVACCIRDARDARYSRNQIEEMICQRVHQIAAGYEDRNDANWLRNPESDLDLALQPTLSRLENAVSSKDLMRISRWLLKRYLKRKKRSRPEEILLDLDSSDDPRHGQQEFSFFHGYFDHSVYPPLLV